jgi:hypothetical protein
MSIYIYTLVEYSHMKAIFVELPAFERKRNQYLHDEAFRQLQVLLMDIPSAGDLIVGTGGLRNRVESADQARVKVANIET